MKESTFIEKNEADWHRLEELLKNPNKDADKLLFLFEKVSGDLAYARTYYPQRSIRLYLNNLTQEVLDSIKKKKKKFSLSDIINFYKHTLPQEIYKSRKAFYVSFLVFASAILIGVVSSANVPDFAETVLGYEYVSMTEDNINNEDPMAVYKKMEQGSMFMYITMNNIRVSFLCFVLGLFGSFGTILVLISNGVMVGTFQYFFYKKGLFLTSFLTIWIHGTIEISAIILAGAAGIILGNGLLFPRSYNRNTSLILSAKRALRIILALMPLFVIAGFLESFVTRLTDMPTILKVLIILLSLLFILAVFVIYPIYYARSGQMNFEDSYIEPTQIENINTEKYTYSTFATSMAKSLARTRLALGVYLFHFLLPAVGILCVALYFILKFLLISEFGIPDGFSLTVWTKGSSIYGVVLWILMTFMFVILMMTMKDEIMSGVNKLKHIKKYFFQILPFSAIFVFSYFFIYNPIVWVINLIIPPHFIFIIFEEILNDRFTWKTVPQKYSFSFQHWFSFLPVTGIFIVVYLMFALLQVSGVAEIVTDFVGWHNIFGNYKADEVFVSHVFWFIAICLPLPFLFYAYIYRYTAVSSLVDAIDLKARLDKFGIRQSLY